MSTGRRTRFTIARGMVVIAGFALILAVYQVRGLAPLLGAFLAWSAILVVGGSLAARRGLELAFGHRCPNCGGRGLERQAVVSFGDRFYSCPACGLRCRRGLIGAYGLYLWGDASNSEYDVHYQKSKTDDPWDAAPGLEDDDQIVSKTHLDLVRSKRLRTPENPNGPGLE